MRPLFGSQRHRQRILLGILIIISICCLVSPKFQYQGQDDPRLLQHIHSSGYLIAPSNESYALKNSSVDPSMGQSEVVKQILGNMTNGFFVECGALDGETRSNTLDLEMHYNWTGLLIEADPKNFEQLERKHRKVWLARACLSTIPEPQQVIFSQNSNMGRIESEYNIWKTLKEYEVVVQCFPLYSLLSAIGQGVKTVDYFSLDVEGNEFQVLRTIPWDKITIRVLSVEYLHDKVSGQTIQDYMSTKGYRVVTKVLNKKNAWAHDFIFAHKSLPFTGTIPPILS